MASILSNPSFSSLLSFSASFPISSMFPPSQKPCKPSKPKRGHASKVACNGNPNNNPTNRRDILIGLGGLYGATTLTSSNTGSAFGAPLSPPDPTNCDPPTVPDPNANCCPPSPFIDYELPPHNTPLRIRPAAHLVTDEYLAKYKEAVKRMKALPPDDPRSFMQQANAHCAYCEGGYKQKGFPDRNLDVHGSWLFFPFHRWYLYFYERILGSLINDPTFALPFWNWDHPHGMKMPPIYTDEHSPLYDRLREASHIHATIDLNYDPNKSNLPRPEQQLIKANMSTVLRAVVRNGRRASQFLGTPYRAGCPPKPGYGTLETIHNTVHTWTGDSTQPNREDMGRLYSAARDPIFFAHHSNVDRFWNIWRTKLPGSKERKDFHKDDDWLNTSFFFYDENKNYVRVKVGDCLESTKMGYDYQPVDLPWLFFPDIIIKPKNLVPRVGAKQAFDFKALRFPLTLNSIERTTVKRPKLDQSRNKEEKEELLVIDVEYDSSEGVRFDVFVNDQGDDEIEPQDSEFAGSFVTLPHSHVHQNTMIITSSFRLSLTDLLKELEVKDDDSAIAVTLVPKYGDKPVTIKDMKIKLVPVVEDE